MHVSPDALRPIESFPPARPTAFLAWWRELDATLRSDGAPAALYGEARTLYRAAYTPVQAARALA